MNEVRQEVLEHQRSWTAAVLIPGAQLQVIEVGLGTEGAFYESFVELGQCQAGVGKVLGSAAVYSTGSGLARPLQHNYSYP